MKTKKFILSIFPRRLRVSVLKLNLRCRSWLMFKNWQNKYLIDGQPILLLSMPRSGSSWLGEVLGELDSFRYLREPITSLYMPRYRKPVSFFMPEKCIAPSYYNQLQVNAFEAYLNFTKGVVANCRDWFEPKIRKKLLIKEINPLYISQFLKNYDPRLIYLERCPYAVAKSFQALGWYSHELFSKRFSDEDLEKFLSIKKDLLEQGFFYQMGFLQGVVKAKVEPYLNGKNSLVINYEQLIVSPESEIQKLVSFLGLSESETLKSLFYKSLSGKDMVSPGSFTTSRSQQALMSKINSDKYESDYRITIEAYELAYNEYRKLK